MPIASKAGRAAAPLSDAAACARAMLDGLPTVMWFIRRQMRRHRTGGLSVPQFRALCLLDRFPTASLSLVAEHLGSSQPSASRLISGLVTRGFVTRRESTEDRRQIALVLTPRGRSVLAAAQRATQQQLAVEIQHLTPAERATIASAMTILLNVFDSTPKQ
jgi:DNA-binding MarR family transcriptional regulator